MVMGLFNRFKSNKNKHAEEFKKAYEANDMEKVNHVLVDWLDDGPHNALFGLAMAILVATRRDKDLVEALAIYKSSIEQDKEDSILFDWYNSTALRLLDEWAGEEINKNPELKNKMDGVSKNDCSNTDFEDLTCKEFSAKFKELYEAFADNDDVSQMMLITDKINQLLTVWERKCPDDSNLPCAYVMVHAPDLSQEDFGEFVFKHASGKRYDESLHEWYQDGLVMAIKFNEAMNE